MPNPLVTVVIPSYNRAQYIAETIESVLGQTYPNIEIIVIDDGSTDNTREIVENYVPRVQYVWQENAERGASRNHGLRLAKGEFISFLDSDDLWLPNKVEDDLAAFQDTPEAGVVFSDAMEIDAEGRELKIMRIKAYSGRVTERLIQNNFVVMATHLVKTELVRKIGGFREERQLSGSEDWEMWVRLSTISDFKYFPKANTKKRTHDANSMTNAEGMNRSMKYALGLMLISDQLPPEAKKTIPKAEAQISLVSAINYCSNGDKKMAAKFLRKSFNQDPRIAADLRFGYTIFRLLGSTPKPST